MPKVDPATVQDLPQSPASASLTRPVVLTALRVSGETFVFEGVNAAFEAATNISALTVVGKTIEDALPPCGLSLARLLCRQCVETGAAVRCLAPEPGEPGRRHYVIALNPVRGMNDEPIVILGCALPLSETGKSGATADEIEKQAWLDPDAAPIIQFTAFEEGWPDRVDASFFRYVGLPFDARPDRLLGAIHPEDRASLTLQARLTPDSTFSCMDVRIRRSDGAWRWFRIRAELVESFGGRRWYGVATDVHERKTDPQTSAVTVLPTELAPGLEKRSSKSEEMGQLETQASSGGSVCAGGEQTDLAASGSTDLLEAVCDAVPAEVALLDVRGRIVWANSDCREAMAALDPPVCVGGAYIEFCRGLIDDFDDCALECGLEDVVDGREPSLSHVYLDRRSGGVRWRQLRVAPLKIGATLRLIAFQEDLTEASEAQAALSSIGEQLLSAQERERQRIAVELHDSTSQHLAALGLGVTRLRQLVGKGHQTREVLDDMSKSLQEAVKEVRVLSYLMKPPGLERDGLQATLESFVRGFGARSGLRIALRTDGPINDVGLDVSHAVYRVVQEALSNVYRHADARSVAIEVVRRSTRLRLRVADDGRGMPGPTRGEGDQVLLGVGIPGMRARIAQLGGRLNIRSDASGTVVSAVTPAVANWRAAGVRRVEAVI
ncbi:MAG TPA: PAS domain-containing protein [Caulobacteraceae bacterium]